MALVIAGVVLGAKLCGDVWIYPVAGRALTIASELLVGAVLIPLVYRALASYEKSAG
jgi:hypothetical protein